MHGHLQLLVPLPVEVSVNHNGAVASAKQRRAVPILLHRLDDVVELTRSAHSLPQEHPLLLISSTVSSYPSITSGPTRFISSWSKS